MTQTLLSCPRDLWSFQTFDQSAEETRPDQQKENDKENINYVIIHNSCSVFFIIITLNYFLILLVVCCPFNGVCPNCSNFCDITDRLVLTHICAGLNKSYYHFQLVSAPIPLWNLAELSTFNKGRNLSSFFHIFHSTSKLKGEDREGAKMKKKHVSFWCWVITFGRLILTFSCCDIRNGVEPPLIPKMSIALLKKIGMASPS